MKKKIKDGSLYFRQRDIARPLGLFLMAAGLVLIYFGWTWASYVIACIITPAGLVMFFVCGSRIISDKDLKEQIDHVCRDYDKPITAMDHYDRIVLRQPAPVETAAYGFGENAAYFKRNKGATPVSDRYSRAHFFFTGDALLVIGLHISITELGVEGAGVTPFSDTYAYADITAALEEHRTTVKMTVDGKSATVKWYELVITERDGDELLRLPVQNDMDVSGLCDELARRTKS